MKKRFEITIKGTEPKPEDCKEYTYIFDRRETNMTIGRDFISFSVSMDTKRAFDDILRYDSKQPLNKTVNHAVKSAFLIHIIRYSEHIKVKTMTVHIDDEEREFFYNDKDKPFPIFSLVDRVRDEHGFPDYWQNSDLISDKILSRKKSGFNAFDSAFYALIYAKNKEFETERLVYLWMSMNGLYNHFVSMCNCLTKFQYISSKNKIKEYSTRNENNQMRIFSMFHNWGNDVVEGADKERIAYEVINILANYNGNIFEEQLSPDENGEYHGELAKAIKEKLVKKLKDKKGNEYSEPYDITPYGYLMFGLPYYYRCNVFHANKPVYMFAYADENNIKVLNIINNLLERFIEKELFEWFHDELVLSFSDNNKDYSQINSEIKNGIIKRFDGVMIENHYKKDN